MSFDKIDLKILNCLKKNARISYKDIGEEIGLTSPAVTQRIQKMESEGVIKRYKVELDYAKLGIHIKATITVKLDNNRRFPQFLKEYIPKEEILSYHRVTGEDCMLLHGQFRDNLHLLHFLDQISDYGVTKTSVILEEIWCD